MSDQARQRVTKRHPELVEAFGLRLNALIAATGLSQRRLADTLGGFRNNTLSRLTRGELTAVPVDLVVKLAQWADAEGVSVRWLLTGDGDQTRPDRDSRDAISDKDLRLLRAMKDAKGVTITIPYDQETAEQ